MCVYDVFDVHCVTFFDALCVLRVSERVVKKKRPCEGGGRVCVCARVFLPSLPPLPLLSPAAGVSISLTGLEYFFFFSPPPHLPHPPFIFLVRGKCCLLFVGSPWGEKTPPGSQVIQTHILQSLATYFTLSLGFSLCRSCFGFCE